MTQRIFTLEPRRKYSLSARMKILTTVDFHHNVAMSAIIIKSESCILGYEWFKCMIVSTPS